MPVLPFKLDRAFLRGMAQAFDLTGSLTSERYREIRERSREQALARDWENVTGDWDRAVGRCAAAHGQ
ncbi:MAG TPA: hypothetical protein VFJ82_08700 [Longimicrobium sp.]|nr:hypothetical protein [Longimicrobium sp.]